MAAAAGFHGSAHGAINPGGVVNAASFAPSGLPNSGIAQGSMFNVFGEGLAAAGLHQAGQFPLPVELGGTRIQVESGGQAVDCFMIFTTPGQLAAILPSNTPLGTGVVRVNFNGQVFSEPVEIVASSVGIFSQNASGAGPGSVQNFVSAAETPVNGIFNAANEGQAIIIWATGLGGVEGAEGDGPLPGTKPAGVTVRVYIDGLEAPMIDYGRSGEFAGIDQIAVFVPQGSSSCGSAVQVVTEAGGQSVTSNTVTIATAPGGSTCSDPGGIDSSELSSAEGEIRLGFITLERNEIAISTPEFGTAVSFSDGFDARFLATLGQSVQPGAEISLAAGRPGSCRVQRIMPPDPDSEVEPPPFEFLDAGEPLTLRGPGGRQAEAHVGDFGFFTTAIAQGMAIGGTLDVDPFYVAGNYSVSGPGGADVGPFEVPLDLPEFVEWTNRDIDVVNRSAALTVTWTGGRPGQEVVQISGASTRANAAGNQVGALFMCFADPGDGQFTIPPHILQSLPANDFPAGALNVGSWSIGQRFEASGIDFGVVQYKSLFSRGGIDYR